MLEDIADESIIEDDVDDGSFEDGADEAMVEAAEDMEGSAPDDIGAEDEEDWASAPVAIKATRATPVAKYFIFRSPLALEGLGG